MVQDDGEGGSGASWLKLLVIRSSSQPCQQEIVGDAATPGNIRDTGQGSPQPRWTMPAARIRSTPESGNTRADTPSSRIYHFTSLNYAVNSVSVCLVLSPGTGTFSTLG